MPEGPEVYVLAHALKKKICRKGVTITGVASYNMKYGDIEDTIINLGHIDNIFNRGKAIIFVSGDTYIVSRLGLKGWWYFDDQTEFVRLRISFGKFTISYCDSMNIGSIHLYHNYDAYIAGTVNIGPDYLNNRISPTTFLRTIRKYPRRGIISFLMDQKIFSGIGNYLVSEILYRAKIDPHRHIGSLTDTEIMAIYRAINYLMAHITKLYNKSHDHITDVENTVKQVYKRKLDKHGNKITREKIFGQRFTYYVKKIQK